MNIRPECGKWSSNDASMTLDKVRLMPRYRLIHGRSNLEHDKAGVKAMEQMKRFGTKSSRRRL
jgi:hypothetical protein